MSATQSKAQPIAPLPNSLDAAEDESFGVSHHTPLVLALGPPLASLLLGGHAAVWTDVLLMSLAGFYLYQLIRVPWELYYSARQRRVTADAQKAILDSSKNQAELHARQEALRALQRTERFSLALTLAVPFIGSSMLHFLKPALSDPDRFINPYTIRLFCLATGIKPLRTFFRILKERSFHLQSLVHLPASQLDLLTHRIDALEKELQDVRKTVATKKDLHLLHQAVDVPLTDLVKVVRRHERTGEMMRITAEERLDELDSRVDDLAAQSDRIAANLQQPCAGRRPFSDSLWYFLDRLFFQLPIYAWRDEGLGLAFLHLAAFLLLLPISLPLSCSSAFLRAITQKARRGPAVKGSFKTKAKELANH